jgi:hypothetical protein
MKRSVVVPLAAAVAACGLSWAAVAAASDPSPVPSPVERMQRWTEDHAALLTAKLAGLKAGLKLTTDQEKLWGPFESSVRDAAQAREDRMKARMEASDKDGADEIDRPSPVERLDKLADRLSQSGSALKKVADAAKPLYVSLDDGQKRIFGYLSRELMMIGHPRMMGGPGPRAAWMGPHHRGPDGMGMMRGPDGPGPHGHGDMMGRPPGPHPDDGGDGPDEE